MHELRCGTTLHGRMMNEFMLEVKCKRRACGHTAEVVVLHSFDIRTGKLIGTRKFANPRKEVTHGTTESIAAIRAS